MTQLIVGPRGSRLSHQERYCPSCGATADRLVYAPPGFYRCPECDLSMPFRHLPLRTVNAFLGPNGQGQAQDDYFILDEALIHA
jgi:hypothetical protein